MLFMLQKWKGGRKRAARARPGSWPNMSGCFLQLFALCRQNNKMLSFDVLSDASGPVCLLKIGRFVLFRGNFKCPERFWHPENFKPHLVLNTAQATTCPPSKTFFSSLFFKAVLNRCFLEKLLLLLSNYWNPHLRHDPPLQKEKQSSITVCPFDLKEKKKKAGCCGDAGPTLAANYFCELLRGFFLIFTSVKNCFIASFACVSGSQTEEQTRREILIYTNRFISRNCLDLKKQQLK